MYIFNLQCFEINDMYCKDAINRVSTVKRLYTAVGIKTTINGNDNTGHKG